MNSRSSTQKALRDTLVYLRFCSFLRRFFIRYQNYLSKIRRANGPWRVRVCFGNPWSFIPWISLIMAAALGAPVTKVSHPAITRSDVFGLWRPTARFLSIFWRPRTTSKKQWFFESSKIDQNGKINRPWSAQGRFLEQKPLLLGSLLASIFRLFPKTAKVCYKRRV